MGFFEDMKGETLIRTENGALGHLTSKSALVDLNFATGSMRTMSDDEIIDRFWSAWNENQTLALRWLFFARDIRNGGMGERRIFCVILSDLIYNEIISTERFFSLYMLIEKYGRLDDFINLIDIVSPMQAEVIVEIISMGLAADTTGMLQKKPISLLAKWMPSINTSAKETRDRAAKYARAFGISHKEYRTMLSKLRAYLDVTEVKASANDWANIDYSKVPSYANLKFSDAFLKHDQERRRKYLDSLSKGEVKINASTLYPYNLVHKYGITNRWYRVETDETIEALWKALPDYELKNTLVVADGSGSMTVGIGGGVTALDVANSIAIYASEHNKGDFADKYITFSSRPQFVEFNHSMSLNDKLRIAYDHDECSNTDIKKVFNLILKTAIKNRTPQEEMPERILIISDMEFDEATSGYDWDTRRYIRVEATLFDTIKEEYAAAGYKVPRLVFWNVNSRTMAIPMQENELGVGLVSGFSPAIFDMVMSEQVTPYSMLVEKLDNYKEVDILLN